MPVAGRARCRLFLLRFPLAVAVTAALWGGACLPPAEAPPGGPSRPVTLLVEPDAGAAPVLELLASARESLWMEMYLLTAEDAIAAIEGRARAGCDVRVTLEPSPYQDDGANQPAYDRLAAAGAVVRWSPPRFSFTHAKAFTIDHARLVVMTLNLTASGLGGNRELAVVDDDARDVAAAEAVFAADQTGGAAAGAARVVTSPDSSRSALTGLIDAATSRLAVVTEELADTGLASALEAARARGVAVTVVWPGPASSPGAAALGLARAGVAVRAVATPTIHAKALVADGRAVCVGSANLSSTSLDGNRELGLLLADPPTAAAIEVTITADAARGTAVEPL